jgi:tungstate transport system ATP-binding protein
MLFEVKNLTKVYGGRKVLDIPDLQLEKRKVYGLLGPNGSGKTTLLEILSFLMRPTTGDIVYDSREVVFSETFLQGLRREVAMGDQQPILFTTSVYKNVEFGLRIRQVPKKRRKRIVDEVLDLVRMRDFAPASAHKLSGGETQRVAIARAVACFPKVILFDEPTSNVDIENQITIEGILRNISTEKGISVIFTTHNRIQATKVSDRIVFLFKGKPASSIYENIFSGSMKKDGQGNTYCLIYDKVRLAVQTDKTGWVRISVDPKMVKVFPVHDNTQRNHRLDGRVIQLTDEGDDVRVLVDIGIPINALLGREAYKQAPILAGDRVVLVCPPESIEVV